MADVALVNRDPPARIVSGHGRLELLHVLVIAPIAGRDVRALIGQLTADRGADATGAPGDQRHPSLDQGRSGPLHLLGLCGCHRIFPSRV
jgi:hypothetical protein